MTSPVLVPKPKVLEVLQCLGCMSLNVTFLFGFNIKCLKRNYIFGWIMSVLCMCYNEVTFMIFSCFVNFNVLLQPAVCLLSSLGFKVSKSQITQ